jgi:hypothetical protein
MQKTFSNFIKLLFTSNFSGMLLIGVLSSFIVSYLYAYSCTEVTKIYHSISTIFFIVFLIFAGFQLAKRESLFELSAVLFCIYLGLGAYDLFSPGFSQYLLVADSVNTHWPRSLNIIELENIFDFSGFTTHLVTGLFIKILGENMMAVSLSQFSFKIIGVLLTFQLAKRFWATRTAYLAALIYSFCPTVFFYNSVLYKESAVQMYVAAILLTIVNLQQKKEWKYIFGLVCLLLFLYFERYYLVYFIAVVFVFTSNRFDLIRTNKFKFAIFYTLLIGWLIYFLFENNYSLEWFVRFFESIYVNYNSYTDFSREFNQELPFVLKVVKIFFTPYFTFQKFHLFNGHSYLLIWGSFVNQLVISLAIYGYILRCRAKGAIADPQLVLPFFILIILLSIVSPWNGRLRDSFYPLISVYSAFGASVLFSSLRGRDQKKLGSEKSDKVL